MTIENPYTNEIIKDSLMSIGEEMFVALSRTSMSPIIYEVLDYACGLTDSKGNLISQGNGVTSFIGMLSPMVRSVLSIYADGKELYDGDIIIINNPYVGGGSHLSDIGLVMPIFYNGELIAFSANKGHWTDVGGKNPGSITSNSKEIYQEGLQLSGVKLFNKGTLNKDVVRIIKDNIRLPQYSIGDMWAQVAALKTGRKRFENLCEVYSPNIVKNVLSNLIKSSELYADKVIKKLPNGVYEAEDFIEGDTKKGGPYKIKVKVTIKNNEFICDFRGSHKQVESPVNCSYYGLLASVRVIFLAILRPDFNITEGLFKPLKIITDKQSIVSAERPAPVALNFEARIGGAELIWKALAPIMPDRLSAGHSASVCTVTISGKHADTGEDFLLVEPSAGGWGASKEGDGQHGQFCMGNGETYNVPIEIAETKYGIRVEEFKFRNDPSALGENIGGKGLVRSYRMLGEEQYISASFGRFLTPPWGMNDGENGSTGYINIIKSDGSKEGPFGMLENYKLSKDDIVQLVTPSGGAYGDINKRTNEKIIDDLRNELYTKEKLEEATNKFKR